MEPIENEMPASRMMAVPDTYLMISLRGMLVVPFSLTSFDVAREKSIVALNRAVERNEYILLAPQRRSSDNPAPKDIYRFGTVCRIRQVVRMPNNVSRLMVEGIKRVRITNYVSINPCFEVETEPFPDCESDPIRLEALKNMIGKTYNEISLLDTKIPQEVADRLDPDEPDKFCGNIADYAFRDFDEKVKFLQTDRLEDRMEQVLIALNRFLELLKVEKKISVKVRKSMEQSQKEYFLREQVKAIHEELGDAEEDLDDYRKRAAGLPEEPKAKVEKELSRLDKMNPTSPEAGVSRSYIEWLLDLPWTEETEDNRDLAYAKRVLDEDHFGLEKVKDRILEYIAVMTLTHRIKGPILCFVGPPGVGKTSIVRSIARALGRKFVSMSLGGVKDEAEIRGHRRTYVGAIPGGIIYHIKQADTVNPVFLLDEIDKMSNDYRGDPASAMLEVLDPEQNSRFRDHYLETAYDLSRVLFVTTANSLETIPAPLLDRMEVIQLSGYTEEEKTEIAKRFLIPKQCEANGLGGKKIEFEDEAVRSLITEYTRESGVRNLERNIGNICRKLARRIVEGDDGESFVVTAEDVRKNLGVPYRESEIFSDRDEVGEVSGLAYTEAGGSRLPVEAALAEGKGEILLTGKLGDVLKESARAAITVVRTHAAEYGIDPERFAKTDIHLHLPEGAIPKDGPSAGITIATAILSAFTERPVDRTLAMTGEITLRGKVLPIGGLKEKLLAARRAGIKTVLIPKDNERDLAEIPESITSRLEIRPVSDVTEVWERALGAKE